jgi:hypothetical protein
MDDVRVTGLVVLALGFAASATVVVPSFDQLVHGSGSTSSASRERQLSSR